jgi:hypothetical protein
MRFFEQKKTLKPDDLSVLRSLAALFAEWTGLEPSPYRPHFQYFICLQKYNSRITRLFFATV